MVSKSKVKKAVKKATSSSKAGAIGRVAAGALGLVKGGSQSKTGGSRKRSRGPTYWANKVLVQKLKSKYYRLKFAGSGR